MGLPMLPRPCAGGLEYLFGAPGVDDRVAADTFQPRRRALDAGDAAARDAGARLQRRARQFLRQIVGCRRTSYAATRDRRVSVPTFSASRGVSAPHSYLIEVLSAVGKSLGTGMVTEPVAAHSVPR